MIIDYDSTFKQQLYIEDFMLLDEKNTIMYEQYIRSLRTRAKGILLRNMKIGYTMDEIIQTGKLDIYGNIIPSAMKELRLRCSLNKFDLKE